MTQGGRTKLDFLKDLFELIDNVRLSAQPLERSVEGLFQEKPADVRKENLIVRWQMNELVSLINIALFSVMK